MNVVSPKWMSRHFSVTKNIAAWSKDPNTKVGALIVSDIGEPVSWGYNGIPMNVNDDPSRFERPIKYHFMAHAERNAMDLASRSFFDNCVLFCTHSPCSGCTTSIVNRRMHTVACLSSSGFLHGEFISRHENSLACHHASLEMMTECGILYLEFDEHNDNIYQIQKYKGEKMYVRKIYG